MCGIAGIVSLGRENKFCEDRVRETLEEMSHRGPDHRGIFYEKIDFGNLCLGINRLAIIDLTSTGNQPMHLDDLAMVYNGEIYNYLEIKDILIKKGHRFNGNSDSEVVLHAFNEWGLESISRFRGMFAVVIFDKKKRKLYLIRDRVGEKPLYYCFDDSSLFFSSELKGLLIHNSVDKEIDESMVFNYFIFNCVAAPHTLFKKIKQVSPGEIVIVSFAASQVEVETKTYWNLPELMPDYTLTEERVLSDLTKILYESIRMRLRSDVPVGVFLSGGIDSSLIAAIACEVAPGIKTFTIGYKDKKHDESGYAEFVAKHIKTTHTNIMLAEKDANLDFEKLSYISDSCVANPSIIPYYSLAKIVRENVKVVLSGDGGDEFFCGYTRYNMLINIFKYRHLIRALTFPLRFNKKANVLNKIVSGVNSLPKVIAQFYMKETLKNLGKLFKGGSNDRQIYCRVNLEEKLFQEGVKPSFWNVNYYYCGGNYLTDNILEIADRVSMYHSLETRSVFTDHTIIEYMSKVPESIILKKGIDKFLLKKILSRYIPKEFVFRRLKQGFAVPLVSDYERRWKVVIKETNTLISNILPVFFDMKRVKNILASPSNKYNKDMQFRLIFLTYFMKRWFQ